MKTKLKWKYKNDIKKKINRNMQEYLTSTHKKHKKKNKKTYLNSDINIKVCSNWILPHHNTTGFIKYDINFTNSNRVSTIGFGDLIIRSEAIHCPIGLIITEFQRRNKIMRDKLLTSTCNTGHFILRCNSTKSTHPWNNNQAASINESTTMGGCGSNLSQIQSSNKVMLIQKNFPLAKEIILHI